MLVLSRHENESVIITVPPSTEPRRIRVLVMDVRKFVQRVRLGIDAPQDCTIHRDEVQALVDAAESEVGE